MVRTLLVCATTGEPKENAPFDPPVTFGSLPDDALASIMDKLSAQDAARAEPTSKTFRRLRPRVVAAQRNHALQWPICHVTEGDLTVHRHNWPGECHAFFFLDRLARTLPDFPDSRRIITRDLERRFGVEGWDLATLSEIVTTAQGDRDLALKSILATGSPEAWHTWRSTWPDHPFMPGSSMAL